jgi:hypothetical protein
MSKSTKRLTHKRVRELLDYDPETGVLTWRYRKGFRLGAWNAAHAGKPAFTANNDKRGAKRGRLLGRTYLAHRVIWFWMTGYWPIEIDHDNGDAGDNRWENLFEVTHALNTRNAKRRCDNTSGHTGIYPAPNGKFIACVGNNYLGRHDSLEQALLVRKEAMHGFGFSERHGQ